MPNSPSLSPAWITVAAAALQLSVSEKTVRRMISRGELPARRLGSRLLRVDASALADIGRAIR